MFNSNREGFTLIEMLIVLSIIGVILGMTLVYFPNSLRNSRNTRRQVDIEQVRVALENARADSVNATYPTAAGTNFRDTLVPRYLPALPTDPRTRQAYNWHYAPVNAANAACTNISPNFCTSYTMYLDLEPLPATSFVVARPLGTQVSATHP